jgi:hypothetical protein
VSEQAYNNDNVTFHWVGKLKMTVTFKLIIMAGMRVGKMGAMNDIDIQKER